MSDLEHQRDELKMFLKGEDSEINESELIEVTDKFQHFSFKKKEILIRPGEVSGILFYVLSGVQRSYYLTDKEYTIAFSYDGFCAVPDSFLLNKPSKHYLEAVTDSSMLGIKRKDIYDLMDQYSWLNKIMTSFQELMVCGLHDRITEIMALSMEERFNVFCERSFHLFAKVPHKHIASYLNMDPTNLSKLLNKKLV